MKRSAPYCESRILQEIVHVRDADEIEISRNRVLQASSGQTEVDARLVVQFGLETVEHTSRESIATTDAIDDAPYGVCPRRPQAVTRHELGGKVVVIDALLCTHSGRNPFEVRKSG